MEMSEKVNWPAFFALDVQIRDVAGNEASAATGAGLVGQNDGDPWFAEVEDVLLPCPPQPYNLISSL